MQQNPTNAKAQSVAVTACHPLIQMSLAQLQLIYRHIVTNQMQQLPSQGKPRRGNRSTSAPRHGNICTGRHTPKNKL
jgi:hypothetical protein